MARFMDVHTHMKGVSYADLKKAHEEDLKLEGGEKVHFIEAWADPKSGRVFCLSEAPDIESVQRVHTRAGHPADEIYPVPLHVQ